jgi:hypothetical protein
VTIAYRAHTHRDLIVSLATMRHIRADRDAQRRFEMSRNPLDAQIALRHAKTRSAVSSAAHNKRCERSHLAGCWRRRGREQAASRMAARREGLKMGEKRAHDSTQRRLFGHVEILKMLVEGFVPAKIIAGLELDLDRAEQLKDTFVSEGLAAREADMLWKIPQLHSDDAALYICILLEFQSSVDPVMPIRIMQYVSFIYENMARADGFKLGPNTLPPVLPVVLYNGSARWGAAVQVRDLIASPAQSGLSPYLPTLRFLLIDEGRIPTARLNRINTILAQLFRLENISKPTHIKAQVEHIISQLKEQLPDDLQQDIALFISELLKPHHINLPPHILLADKENCTMLADAFAQLKKDAAEKGLKEGREEGQRELLGKQLALKFGPNKARAAALGALSPAQIELAAALILSADSEDAIFAALTAAR